MRNACEKIKQLPLYRHNLSVPVSAMLKKAEVKAQNSTAYDIGFYDIISSLPHFTAHVWACAKYILPVMNHGSNSLLYQEKTKVTYRLPVHSLCKLSVWVESTVNIRRISAIEPETMFFYFSQQYLHKPLNDLDSVVIKWLQYVWMFTCEGSLVPCLRVCNTASQTPALQAGDLASPSPFLW